MRDLTRANELIATISKENPQITPITPEDFDLFQSFFVKEPYTYGNSWTYITQGMYGIGPDKLGYKYYDGKNLSAICVYPKIEKPDQLVLFWIRPMGPAMMSVAADMSKKLHREHGINVYAKKLFREQYNELLNSGFRDMSVFPWHSLYHKEDDTYPELVLDIAHTLEKARILGTRDQLGSSYRYYQKYIADSMISENRISGHENESKYVVDTFFEVNKHTAKLPIVSDPMDYYAIISGLASRGGIYDSFFTQEGKPVGFYFAERNTTDIVSLYALISLRHISNHIADYMLCSLLERLLADGVKKLNLGGSENENLHRYKNKYLPAEEIQMYWATLI